VGVFESGRRRKSPNIVQYSENGGQIDYLKAMARLKPIAVEPKFGIVIGVVVLATTLIGTFSKWKEFYSLFAPNGVLLNWRFVFLLIFLASLIVWFIMNYFWQKEQLLNADLELKIENLKDLLKSSEMEHLMDPITGVPNVRSLENDFDSYFQFTKPQVQFVFLDLKEFGRINKEFLSQKTNRLIRYIAQSIYLGMRRNENMFKFPATGDRRKNSKEGFYRIYPGGDEFVFMIEGDQSDAIGFVNRLRDKFFGEFSQTTETILGVKRELSFYCSIVQIDPRDKSFEDIFSRAEICYRTVWSSAQDNFAITWYPNNAEVSLCKKDERKAVIYRKAREIFEVVPMVQIS
jgi:GGDEF domain-containing protein